MDNECATVMHEIVLSQDDRDSLWGMVHHVRVQGNIFARAGASVDLASDPVHAAAHLVWFWLHALDAVHIWVALAAPVSSSGQVKAVGCPDREECVGFQKQKMLSCHSKATSVVVIQAGIT
jgi:hypothetical protein